MRSHYEGLGADRGCTTEELRAAWKRLAQRHHPDKGGGRDAYDLAQAAWMVLRDPLRRKLHDRALDAAGARCGACRGLGRTTRQRGPLTKIHSPCGPCRGNGVLLPRTGDS